MTAYTLTLTMLSDWVIGTGTGRHGHSDRVVLRDDDRLPHVPAKTLVGVWRDACEVVAHALDGGPAGPWHRWVEHVFGSQHGPGPRPAVLLLDGPLRLPEELRAALRSRPLVAEAAVFIKPGVKIDRATGAAEDEKFRIEEVARGGVTLSTTAHLAGLDALDEPARSAALALLAAGVQLVETIGGKRRRGLGRCRLKLTGPGLPADLARLEEQPPEPPPTAPGLIRTPVAGSASPAADGAEAAVPASSGWERAELVLSLRTPVLTAARTVANLVDGLDHVPGSALLPPVAQRLGAGVGPLIGRGDLIVSTATLEVAGERGLPVPRLLRHRKDDRTRAVHPDVAGEDAPEAFRSGYVAAGSAAAEPAVHEPAMTVRMHNTVHDGVQRPTDDVGGVYIYRALAPARRPGDQVRLRAEVRLRASAREAAGLPPDWARRLPGQWRIGGSAKDDYGLVAVSLAKPAPAPGAEHGGAVERRPAVGGLLRVWLLSDLLVRDARLRLSIDLGDVARTLREALAGAGAPGVELAPATDPVAADAAAGPDRAAGARAAQALAVRRTESWHGPSGLPRASLVGLAAGSCLAFEVSGGPIPGTALDEVEAAGIGERRAEGFGALAFDHPLLTGSGPGGAGEAVEPAVEPAAHPSSRERSLMEPGVEGYAAARTLERAAWRNEIHRAAERFAADQERRREVFGPDPNPVSSSQLNALRRLVGELDLEAPDRVAGRLRWLTRDKRGRPAWPEETVVRPIESLLTDGDKVWQLLRVDPAVLSLTDAGVAELRRKAIRSLLHATLSAFTRERAAADTGAAAGRDVTRTHRERSAR